MKSSQKRPKFLNLFAIHLPVTGITSFAHRVSGALMVVTIPVVIYLFGLSIRDPQGFLVVKALLASAPAKILLTLLVWTSIHHVLAGIRFLLLDINIGESLAYARFTAWLVNCIGILIFLLGVVKIWL